MILPLSKFKHWLNDNKPKAIIYTDKDDYDRNPHIINKQTYTNIFVQVPTLVSLGSDTGYKSMYGVREVEILYFGGHKYELRFINRHDNCHIKVTMITD